MILSAPFRCSAAVLAFVAASVVLGQSDAPVPKWEAVSIKPCAAAVAPGGRGPQGPGRLSMPCVPVEVLIHQSYLLFPNGVLDLAGAKTQVTGGPAWMYSDRYTIEAKAEDIPGQAPPGQGTMQGPMLRALLADRFQLKVHRGAALIPVYALIVTKDGAALQRAVEGSCSVADLDHPQPLGIPGQRPLPACGIPRPVNGGGMDLLSSTMAQLCSALSLSTDRKVIDKTSLAGMFDIRLDWSGGAGGGGLAPMPPPPAPGTPPPPPPPPGTPSPDPGETTARIQQALRKIGLKLEAAQGPDDNLIVDHVERPGEN